MDILVLPLITLKGFITTTLLKTFRLYRGSSEEFQILVFSAVGLINRVKSNFAFSELYIQDIDIMLTRSFLGLAICTILLRTAGCTAPTTPVSDQVSENTIPPNQPPGKASPPDFTAAAKTLGVKETALIKALGLPDKPPTGQNGNGAPPPRLDVKGAAIKLGVSEKKLVTALNLPVPPHGDRHPPDAPPKP